MSVDHDFEKSCMSVLSFCVFHRVSCNIASARPKFHSDHLLFSHLHKVGLLFYSRLYAFLNFLGIFFSLPCRCVILSLVKIPAALIL